MQEINNDTLVDHYSPGHLLASIEKGILAAGKTTESVTLEDLAVVDEFHIGGRGTTKDLLDQLNLDADCRALDMVMGETTPDNIANLVANVSEGRAVPVEMIARKP